jgi:outer membrane autotransporter protein
VGDASGGSTKFFDASTAGNATITNNGGTAVSKASGFTEFHDSSSAGNATITNNSGTGGGGGGRTLFFNGSDDGTARAITNGNGSFDISGLTSAGMGIGSIEGSGNYFLGSKALTVGGNNLSTTVSGVIQDGGESGGTGGSLTKVGTGTLILTGANTYSGGTTISDGTLQLGNGGTTGSIAGNVTNNGILAFDRSNVLTFGGMISGTGNVQQNGTGTTVLVGDNTYTGGTTISAGTLQLGNGGTAGSIAGNVTDNGILAFDRSDVLAFGGVISGMGSVQQIGIGTTVLTGNNTYTGGTTINTGTLQLGNGGTTGSITGNVLDNGILAFDRSNVLTFGGVISGTGSLQQNGTGTTVLIRDNTYTGATTVNAGNLIVDGSIASAQTLVNAGGLLGGRGSLGGSLVNSGIVGPGDSPGTLTVNRNYTQNASGTLRIEVAGLGATQHDLLAVGGHASLAGTLQLIRLGDFKLHVGDQLTFLTANGGVSGSFGAVQNEFVSGTIVKAEVITLPNAVVLEGTQGSFVPVACTPNAVAVAHALDSAVGDPGASTLISFLDDQPINQLCGDLQLIAPEQLASIFNIGVSLANVQTANLKRRMEDIRAGSSGFSAAGFALNGSAPSVSDGFAGISGPEGKSGPPVMVPTPENRWGVWITGIGEFTNVDSTNEAAGYDLQTGGVTFGVDYRVCPNFAIGLTAGYAHTNADLANGGNLDVNGGTLGLYATVFGDGFYLDTTVTGGPSGYDTHRTALLGTANGSTNGGDFNVLVAAGYDWKKGDLTIGPTANFQYTYVGFDGFTESGSLAPLNVHSQNAESERTAFGMKASYDLKVGHVVIVPQISLAWQHEYGDQAYSIVSSFASGAGNSFTVNSPRIGRDSLLIGAGAAVLLSERISIYAYYDGELFRTNYQSNNVSAGVRVTF